MSCEFAEKISLLIDGELAEAETNSLLKHLENCQNCRNLQEDFLFLRQEIKGIVPDERTVKEFSAERYRLKPDRLWKRKMSLPIPVFTLLLLILGALIGWSILFTENEGNKNITVSGFPIEKPLTNETATLKEKNETTLARFDRGGRAEVIVVRRQQTRDDK